MKLAAAILFAVTNAQRDGGRQREKETPSSSDDAFAAYFGAGFDYGSDYGNAAFDGAAFGDSADEGFDAFGDLNFGSYDYGTEAVDVAAVEESVAADEADAANRPSNNDADDGKTILPGVTLDTNDRTNSAFNGWCWTNSGATKAAWAKTSNGVGKGKWVQCLGSGSACEVKVARKISDGSIVQVTSSCANEESCVANMKQNFNPGTTANNIYSQYVQQACKPFGAAVIGARFKSNNERSTCFFCTEPCTTAEAGAYASTANCVGPSADGVADGAPANAVDSASPPVAIDIFDDTTLDETPGADATNKYTTANYYTTVTGTLTGSGGASITISKIQAVQLGATFTASG